MATNQKRRTCRRHALVVPVPARARRDGDEGVEPRALGHRPEELAAEAVPEREAPAGPGAIARASRSIASRSRLRPGRDVRAEPAQAPLARRAHPAVVEREDVDAVLGEEAGERLVEILPHAHGAGERAASPRPCLPRESG